MADDQTDNDGDGIGEETTKHRATTEEGGGIDKSEELHGTGNDAREHLSEDSKQEQLHEMREDHMGEYLTTDQGVRVNHTDDSLKAGERGPTLMEDFHFREKMTQFDHESIPERVVHARGTGAHGYYQPYEDPDLGEYDDISELTKAKFLTDPDRKTPVFTRFSTVVGSRGSSDTVRDVRGFATKFYTEEGNYDLVGNNMPIFFIHDAIKFPDLIHAVKPEPKSSTPQAATAHDTFWDFASLTPEITHMLMWVLSDRALPRAYRMMQGFGVHTFRFINEEGDSRFVKFHWLPKYGTHSLVWDETTKLWGKASDFNRAGLYNAIESGNYPEWELGIQIVEEDDADQFDFDLLDPTKIIPEEDVPVRRIGKLVLNETVDNFFAETEQVAFHPGNVVPGIDFTNDPLLQGRLFSYQDTQLNRFGSANWDEVPINRPLAKRHTNQRAGFMRQTINKGRTSYSPNSLEDDYPREATEEEGGYVHHAEKVKGKKIRSRSESFRNHFSQAKLFWNSMSDPEKQHLVEAAHFELGNVENREVRERVIYEIFNNVDHEFAVRAAEGIGVEPPDEPGTHHPDHDKSSPALSQENTVMDTIESRQIAVLVDDGFDDDQVGELRSTLEEQGAQTAIISKVLGEKTGANGDVLMVDESHVMATSVVYDAVFVPGGSNSVEAMKEQSEPRHFIAEAFKHKKPIGALGDGIDLLETVDLPDTAVSGDGDDLVVEQGVVTKRSGDDMDKFLDAFSEAIAEHRHWERSVESVRA
ncbi:catalase [Halocatena pleomorpha]|uniref:Catalase n=1 Tax=Halocatena pleomorpha TaxID=1785090 RepID=A0A3P3RDF9_9EURY|nr:catalase [Halocatena pleomorpha]RRJ31461.1 catalase [Halocatena pleomorpha]